MAVPRFPRLPGSNDPMPDYIDEAVDAFKLADFKPGQMIPHDWFCTALKIRDPKTEKDADAREKLQFGYMTAMGGLINRLLLKHSTALRSVHGEGYAIVPPADQALWAKRKMRHDINKGFRKAIARATFVNTSGLSSTEAAAQRGILGDMANLEGAVYAAEQAAKRRARAGGK